jgi:hypothetical protein
MGDPLAPPTAQPASQAAAAPASTTPDPLATREQGEYTNPRTGEVMIRTVRNDGQESYSAPIRTRARKFNLALGGMVYGDAPGALIDPQNPMLSDSSAAQVKTATPTNPTPTPAGTSPQAVQPRPRGTINGVPVPGTGLAPGERSINGVVLAPDEELDPATGAKRKKRKFRMGTDPLAAPAVATSS